MNIGCVLLAAGLSRRFGEENKLLMKLPGGDDLLDRAFAACPPSLFSRAAAVSFSREILARAAGAGYEPVENPGAAEGVASSVRLGAAALSSCDAILFSVCDQPGLTAADVSALLSFVEAHPGRIAALAHRGKRGNPVCFPAEFFPELLALTGDAGGSAVIKALPDRLSLVEAPSRALFDVDTPADAAAFWPGGRESSSAL